MGARGDDLCDLCQMQVPCLSIASGQDQGRALAILRADGTKNIGGGGALIAGSVWTRPALCPPAGDLVLLTDTSFVREPDFYVADIDRLLARNCLQARGKVF